MNQEEEKPKTIEDLTIKELFEDLDYWLVYAQMQCPPFVDKTFDIIKKYVKRLMELIGIETKH